jgi:hypothetical protein
MRRQRPLLILLLALAASAATAGCGSSSSSGGTTGAPPSQPPTSSAPPSSSAPASTSSGGSGSSGGGAGGFCTKGKAIGRQTAAEMRQIAQGGGTRPQKTKASFDLLLGRFGQIVSIAPGEIKPSMQVMLNDLQTFNQQLAKSNYQVSIALLATSPLRSGNFQRAAKKVDTWLKANCGTS